MTDLFIEKDAVISACGLYRYLLRRAWDHGRPRALFVMLNPSTADAEQDDATIRSCVRLCRSWGYGSFEVINLFSWRATDPKEIESAAQPIGPQQEAISVAAIGRCDIPICAWGAHPMASKHARSAYEAIRSRRPAALCLGLTKSGAPKHPLYIKTGTLLEMYQP